MLFYITMIAVTCVTAYIYDVPSKVHKKYKQFRSLNKLVSTRYSTFCTIMWVSLCMIAKMYWMQFLHWANNTIEHKDNNTVIISYVLHNKIYRFKVKHKKGPSNILLVMDEESNDISDIVLPFLGPNKDWHCHEYTPSFWGRKALVFEMADGNPVSFSENEILKL